MSANFSSNSSAPFSVEACLEKKESILNFTAFTAISLLLLPLFTFVLYLGYHRSVSTATNSHSDIFTYHTIAFEMLSIVACCLYCVGTLGDIPTLSRVSMDAFTFTSPGQTLLHLLTCVERYLAVVHPVTYLGLRRAGGVRIRNISIGCVWLICFVLIGGRKVISSPFSSINSALILVLSIFTVSFCSLSVLRVLTRPGPVEVDRRRRRAFYTITAIMGALVLRSVGVLVSTLNFMSVLTQVTCVVEMFVVWLILPSSLVSPLLFLQRATRSEKQLLKI